MLLRSGIRLELTDDTLCKLQEVENNVIHTKLHGKLVIVYYKTQSENLFVSNIDNFQR